jgi:hypothetical protein
VIDGWRGRTAGLAIIALIVTSAVLAAGGSPATGSGFAGPAPPPTWRLVVRGATDEVMLSVPLPDGRFALRYRNSVYGSLAEERFVVTEEGRMSLVELAADEAAVLEEYYSAADRPRTDTASDPLRWRAQPATGLTLQELPLAATRHGLRTLIVDGRGPVPLWQVAGDGGPTLVLEVEAAG